MKNLIALGVIVLITGCSVCKSTDSAEVCRTKHRDHSQPRTEIAVPHAGGLSGANSASITPR
jgi:hypothetical protein